MPYIVTIKLPKRKDHDPRNKVTGKCPVSPTAAICTDVTGEHHSILAKDWSAVQVFLHAPYVHVTRVEEVNY